MAITTSPDNIPSPTSGDPYNYVVDMAALADGTQDALTQKANMGVGTSTQRAAALSKFPDGALWYDTTTDSDWRKLGGAWVNSDTGWVGVTFTSGHENFAGSTPCRVRELNGVVYLEGTVKPTSGAFSAGAFIDVLTLPAWSAPSVTLMGAGGSTAGAQNVSVAVTPSGGVQLRIGTDALNYVGLSSWSWIAP